MSSSSSSWRKQVERAGYELPRYIDMARSADMGRARCSVWHIPCCVVLYRAHTMRRRPINKTDVNESDIVAALRAIPGCCVETGHDDILVGYKGRNYWFEIKNPDEVDRNGKPYKRNNNTYKRQTSLANEWTGHYEIVTGIDQILVAMDLLKYRG